MNTTSTDPPTHLSGGIALILMFIAVTLCLYISTIRSELELYKTKLKKGGAHSALKDSAVRLEEGIANEPLIAAASYGLFHTVPGKMATMAILRFDNFMLISLSFIFSQMIVHFVQYQIGLMDNPGKGHIDGLIFIFVIVILYLLYSTVQDKCLRRHVGGDYDVTEHYD